MVEIIADIFLEVVLTIMNLIFQHHSGDDDMNLRWLPRVIVKHPPYRARVRKGNVVNSSLSFPRRD